MIYCKSQRGPSNAVHNENKRRVFSNSFQDNGPFFLSNLLVKRTAISFPSRAVRWRHWEKAFLLHVVAVTRIPKGGHGRGKEVACKELEELSSLSLSGATRLCEFRRMLVPRSFTSPFWEICEISERNLWRWLFDGPENVLHSAAVPGPFMSRPLFVHVRAKFSLTGVRLPYLWHQTSNEWTPPEKEGVECRAPPTTVLKHSMPLLHITGLF